MERSNLPPIVEVIDGTMVVFRAQDVLDWLDRLEEGADPAAEEEETEIPPIVRSTDTVSGVTRDVSHGDPGPDRHDFATLRQLTDEALDAAEGQIEDAVNWGDIHCQDIRQWTDETGASGYQVVIQEASPDAQALRTFVVAYLAQAGFVSVEVVTEW